MPTLERLQGGSGTRCLVLTPTRELAIQVSEQFHRLGKHLETSCAVIYGGVDYEPQFQAFQDDVDIVVATPGRLLDHLNRKSVHFRKLEILIIDEADRMLDMGFAEEITDILKRLPEKRQTMLFSATMPQKIQDLANRAVSEPVQINISTPSTPAEGIHHGVYPISMANKPRGVLGIIDKYNPTSVLIFTRTKTGADVLCNFLENEKISVAKIHSDRSQRQRESALAGFRQGKHRILVATDIVSRGIDVTGISHVINYDVPEYPEDYVHRAGRTARAGRHRLRHDAHVARRNHARQEHRALHRQGAAQGRHERLSRTTYTSKTSRTNQNPCSTSQGWRAMSAFAKCRAARACPSVRLPALKKNSAETPEGRVLALFADLMKIIDFFKYQILQA